ncbi:MAG TPA: formyltetrahydrofolate deformylase [Acidimicrobiales bacterium]|nr:formyltetrahydrofolate deformylase [Acidimicrobiales bacterium]
MVRYLLTLTCPDRPGIVRAMAQGIVAVGGNILENAQFSDPATGTFCVRTGFETVEEDLGAVRRALSQELVSFSPTLAIRPEDCRRRAIVMVSKLDHCLVDLLYRLRMGELPIEVPLVVSNHTDLREVARREGVEFEHVPVTPDTKPAAEAKLLDLVKAYRADFVILARYMQVLSDDLCRQMPGRIINIHHSFLPGFKGARPYHQAYQRGVKLIGATAHYVTADLDEGPIIEQDVVRVGHGQSVDDLVILGRDVERVVLARAVALHAEERVMLAGPRTIVFRP